MNFGNSAYWRSRLTKASRGWQPYALLAVLSAMLCIPGLYVLPLTGSAEGEAAQIARQIAQDHTYFTPQFQDEPITPRPGGNSWLQAVCALASGKIGCVWPYRIPSFLAMLGCALAIFVVGRSLFTPERGLLAALLFLINPVSLMAAQSAFSSSLAAALIALNITALALAFRHNFRSPGALPSYLVLLFWLSAGLGVLVCGILPGLVLGGVLAAIRMKEGSFHGLRGLFPVWGIFCGVVPALPWFHALKGVVQQAGELSAQAWVRFLVGGDYPLWTLPGGNLLPLLLLFWPGIFFVVQAVYVLRRKRTRQSLFCLGWLLPPMALTLFLPFSAPVLALPALPALSLLCADFVLSPERMPANRLLRGAIWTACILGAFVPGIVLALLTWGIASILPLPPVAWVLIGLGGVFGLAAACYVRIGARLRLCLVAVVFTLLAAPLVMALLLPSLRAGWLPLQVAKEYARIFRQGSEGWPNNGDVYPVGNARFVCLGLPSPELVFYTGATTLLTSNPAVAADQLLTCPGDCVATLDTLNPAFLQALAERRLMLNPVATIHGFYALNGQVQTVYFYQTPAQPSYPAQVDEGADAPVVGAGYGRAGGGR